MKVGRPSLTVFQEKLPIFWLASSAHCLLPGDTLPLYLMHMQLINIVPVQSQNLVDSPLWQQRRMCCHGIICGATSIFPSISKKSLGLNVVPWFQEGSIAVHCTVLGRDIREVIEPLTTASFTTTCKIKKLKTFFSLFTKYNIVYIDLYKLL